MGKYEEGEGTDIIKQKVKWTVEKVRMETGKG